MISRDEQRSLHRDAPLGWVERDARVVWHGFTQMTSYEQNVPVIVERAEGHELIDVDGKRYLDAISSLWVNTLGHRRRELDEALIDQVGKVAHSTMLGNGSRVVVELSEELAPRLPVDEPHLLYASDGAAAVEQALKISFQYWVNSGVEGRTTYLVLGDAYHGDTVGSLSLGAGGFGTDLFDPLRFGVIRAPGYADPLWCDYACAVVRERAASLAAVVIEPLVQAAGGLHVADPADVARLAHACRQAGVLLVADEVATGFGRTGSLFASERCGIRPDLLCLGKGITGGYLPMSVTAASGRVFQAFLGEDLGERTFYHGHSYGGNALAAAVALRHLRLLDELAIVKHVDRAASYLGERLAGLVSLRGVEGVRGVGLIRGVALASSGLPGRRGRLVCAEAVRRGVVLRPLGDVVVIVPPLDVGRAECDRIVDTLISAIEATDPEAANPGGADLEAADPRV